MRGWVWHKGKIQSWAKASIPILDRGFLYGEALYETLRTFQGLPFLEDRHYKRLCQSMKILGIPKETAPRGQWLRGLRALLPKGGELRIRAVVTRGSGMPGRYLHPRGRKGRFYLLAHPFKPLPARALDKGVHVAIHPLGQERGSGPALAKTHELLGSIRLKQAHPKAFEVIRLSPQGYVAEGSGTNVFWVERRTLVTPSLSVGILDGVTRGLVIHLAQKGGIRVRQTRSRASALKRASQAFVTNTTGGIVPIRSLDGGPKNPRGEMVFRLRASLDAYRAAWRWNP